MEIYYGDFTTAFLNGILLEHLYIQMLKGFGNSSQFSNCETKISEGPEYTIVGIQVKYDIDNRLMHINQQRYILDKLNEFELNMQNRKSLQKGPLYNYQRSSVQQMIKKSRKWRQLNIEQQLEASTMQQPTPDRTYHTR